MLGQLTCNLLCELGPQLFSDLTKKNHYLFFKNEILMKKTKFQIAKAIKAVEISSRIEGHKISREKTTTRKRTKTKAKY